MVELSDMGVVDRLLAQTALQPGLASVLAALLSFSSGSAHLRCVMLGMRGSASATQGVVLLLPLFKVLSCCYHYSSRSCC